MDCFLFFCLGGFCGVVATAMIVAASSASRYKKTKEEEEFASYMVRYFRSARVNNKHYGED